MKWIKKIAERVLSKEIQAFKDENKRLRNMAFGNRKYLVSQPMMICIVDCLPDPNKVGNNVITAEEITKRNMNFVDKLGGSLSQHRVFVSKIEEKENEKGAVVHISDYEIDLFIPLRQDDITCQIHTGIGSVNTFFWDFYRAGIRVIDNENWTIMTDFMTAVRDTMKSLKEENLL